MSSLTKNCKKVYVPMLYDSHDVLISEGYECDDEESAVYQAKENISCAIDTSNYDEYYYAKIETRIIPLYGE